MSTPSTPRRPDDIRADDEPDRAMTMLPRYRRTAADARDWLRRFLAAKVADHVVDEAALVLSELTTNALRHCLGELVVRTNIDGNGAVQLSVTDSGPELPELQPVDPTRIGGLGLRIVDQLSSGWGVAPFPGGKTVWAIVRSR